MAALHFDFCLALQIFSDAEINSYHSNKSDQRFGENETNKKIFANLLNSLKDIEMKHPKDLVQSLAGS